MRVIKELLRSVQNLGSWLPAVWRWRWWDYGYTLDIIVRDLELRSRKWGKSTRYVGDTFTLGRIQVLLRNYKQWQECEDWRVEDELLKKFLTRWARTLPRLWD